MKNPHLDIFIVTGLALISVALTFLLPASTVVGRIWALPLVLVLPGYALVCALFPKQTPGITERCVFSLGLSLSAVILCGLLLNITPFGITAQSWAIALGSITVSACSVAVARRRQQSKLVTSSSTKGLFGFTFRQDVLLVLAVIIVCGAALVSIIGAQQQPRLGFTQLWILPATGTGAKNTIRLGMSSKETKTTDYRLAVNIDGQLVKEWPSIVLNPNEKWEVTLVLPPGGSTGTKKVEADLYRGSATKTIYRHVVLWLGS